MSNRPRKRTVRSMLATRTGGLRWLGTMAGLAVLGITFGCGASSPTGPTPAPTPTPAPVTPAPVAPGVYTLAASSNTVAPGGELSVSFTASTGKPLDWIGLYRVGDWNGAHGWSSYTDGATSGTFSLTAPQQAGRYEFRYLLNNGVDDAARSGVVTVGE